MNDPLPTPVPAPKAKRNPLREVLGRSTDDASREASEVWDGYIEAPDMVPCPYKLNGGCCHKSKKDRPLSVCAVEADGAVVVCPHRFEEDGIIFDDVWDFLVGPNPSEQLERRVDPEIRMNQADGARIGNADFFVSAVNRSTGERTLCSVEVQGSYISGNLTGPFEAFIGGRSQMRQNLEWDDFDLPHPDFLSSWKRLRSQLLDKGPDLANAGIKQAVVVDAWFFDRMKDALGVSEWADIERPPAVADVALLGYDLVASSNGRLRLTRRSAVYTTYERLHKHLVGGGQLDVEALLGSLDARQKKRIAAERAALAAANQPQLDLDRVTDASD